MKVFISWSGDRSKLVAELLKDWIKCVIQSVQPWVSTQDITRGELWYNAITKQVSQISTGIICLTHENKDKPWILFEAGALAKGLETSRIITFLIDLKNEDLLLSPLSSFNHTTPSKNSVRHMMLTINSLIESPLDETTFEKVFEKFWNDFDKQFNQILKDTEKDAATSVTLSEDSQSELLKELIKTVRNLEKSVYKAKPIFGDIEPKPFEVNFGEVEKQRPVNEDMFKILSEKFKKG